MLHQNDLIFCKTESGVTSCGYNINNMLLKNTLSTYSPISQRSNMGNKGKDDIRIAKLMEDLVVPSGLYYCHPMTKHKVFNYKSLQPSLQSSLQSPKSKDKGEKNEINITDGMFDESMYDKLLSLVSTDKKKLFDKKTRKNKNTFQKIKEGANDSDLGIDVDVDLELPKEEKGEKREKSTKKKSVKLKINTQKLLENQQDKQKPNQRKTKKVRFADF